VGRVGVEVGEGLVQEEELGVGLKHAGERGALAHALRVLGDGPREVRVKTDGAEGELRGAYAVQAAFIVKCSEVAKVLHGGELFVEHGGMAHVGDAAAVVARVAAEDFERSARGGDESGKEAEKGGFASAVFSEDYSAGAGGNANGDVPEGCEGAEET
jgi:hypothetical protein